MPQSMKQLAWANATHQPFAERWNKQYKASGLEKGVTKKKPRRKPKAK